MNINQDDSHAELPKTIRTKRLLLRRWQSEDAIAFAKMNADSRVMEYFPNVLAQDSSDAMVSRIQQQFEEHGFGLWAVEISDRVPFAGFVGLMVPKFEAHFTPCVEIGWRLAAEVWGQGYATEGADAVLEFAFASLGVPEVVAMTTVKNQRSRRVMEKLGMTYSSADDFEHPLIPKGDRVAPHVLYRIQVTDYRQRKNAT